MLSKEELYKYKNYCLRQFQNEIYRQLKEYMDKNNLSQKDIAEKLGVSNAYVSQILNGNFNYTISKLVELSLMMNKIPAIAYYQIKEETIK